MHRLLLGVSATGANVLPWCQLLGCCRHIDPSGPPPNAAATAIGTENSGGALPPGAGGGGDAVDGSTGADVSPQRLRRPTNAPGGEAPSVPSSRATTAHPARRFSRAVSTKHGAGAAPTDLSMALAGISGKGGRGANLAAALAGAPGLPDIREQHTWLHGLLSRPDAATALSRWLPEEVVEAVSLVSCVTVCVWAGPHDDMLEAATAPGQVRCCGRWVGRSERNRARCSIEAPTGPVPEI